MKVLKFSYEKMYGQAYKISSILHKFKGGEKITQAEINVLSQMELKITNLFLPVLEMRDFNLLKGNYKYTLDTLFVFSQVALIIIKQNLSTTDTAFTYLESLMKDLQKCFCAIKSNSKWNEKYHYIKDFYFKLTAETNQL